MFRKKTWALLIFAVVVALTLACLLGPKNKTPVLDILVLENSHQAQTIIYLLADKAKSGRPVEQTLVLMTSEKEKYRVPAYVAASAVLNFYQKEISELPDSCGQKAFLQENLVLGLLSYQNWLNAGDKRERIQQLQAVVASLKAIDQAHVSLIM